MTTQKLVQGTRSSAQLTMGTLASGTYIATSAIDQDLGGTGNDLPLDRTIEVVANANGTPTGNKQLVIFAKLSLDNTNWGSGPESGTTTTEEADLHPIGVLPMNDTNEHRKFFSLAHLPVARYIKYVVKNDCGVALTDGFIYDATIVGDSA